MTADASSQGGAEESSDALSRMIKDASDKGISYAKMSTRGIDPKTGLQLTKAWIQRIASNPPAGPPSEDQLRALAVALDETERRVKAAAAKQWLGYEATELAGYNDEVRIILGHLGAMTESEARQWRAMIEAAERIKRENG